MTSRTPQVAILCAALALVPGAALAGWGAGPTPIHSTTAKCAPVVACDDGAGGAIVSWFEHADASTGVYRARHVLATGDVDPAWPALATLTNATAPPIAMGTVADDLGGAYVWWQLNRTVWLTRVAPGGTVAPGWPAGGRQVGVLSANTIRPLAISDGAHGLYLAWIQARITLPAGTDLRAIHIGPANTGAGGWPSTPRTIGATAEYAAFVQACGVALAPDGGLWVSWGESIFDPQLGHLPGYYWLVRLRTNGLLSPDWTPHGIPVAKFTGDVVGVLVPPMSLVAVAGDGEDGAFVVCGDVQSVEAGGWSASPRLYHVVDIDGTHDPAWPAGGLLVQDLAFDVGIGAPPELSFRAIADGGGGVFVGFPQGYDHGTSLALARYDASGTRVGGDVLGSDFRGFEVASDAGEVYAAACNPSGPTGPYQPNAFIGLARLGGGGYGEYHPDPVVTWYGDVAVAATHQGNALFFWSQNRERFGIFAIQLTPSGPVTSAPPLVAASRLALALRWDPGEGVRTTATFAAPGPATLTLHDVAGRAVASARFDAEAGARSWTLPETRELPAGLYFARLASGGLVATAKVAISH